MAGEYPYWGAGSIVDHVDRYLFDEELVLLGEDGAPFFDVGREVAFRVTEPVWVNNHIHVLRPNNRVDGRFLTYALNAVDYSTAISGATRDKLTQEDMKSISVPLPPVEEQRRIADFLDDQVARIDALISSREQQIAQLGDRLTVQMKQLMQREPKVPMRRLVREVVVGIVVKPADLYTDEADGVPALRGTDISEGSISRDGHVRITQDGHRANPRSRLAPGDVVVVRTGEAGSAAVVPEWAEDWNCIDLVVVRASAGVEPKYLEWILNSAKRDQTIQDSASGAMQQHFGVGALLALPAPGMDTGDQAEIVKRLDSARQVTSQATETIRQSVGLLEERKRSLITAAVTGELDVTTAKPIGMGKWVPNVGASVEAPAIGQASVIGRIG